MTYTDFLKSKIDVAPMCGVDVQPQEVNQVLKPHQRDCVIWAAKGGRRGVFARFGLGKTIIQLEYCRLILKHRGGRALIVLPLNVKPEFVSDAMELLGIAEVGV